MLAVDTMGEKKLILIAIAWGVITRNRRSAAFGFEVSPGRPHKVSRG